MRISVECGSFDDAADACRTANQTAAVITESLAGKLAGFGAMAGNDANSADFATSYDAAARGAVGSLTDLTHAFIGLGRLLAVTGANHAAAEAAAAGRVTTYSGRGLTGDGYVRVTPSAPPSSLGAQEPSLGIVDRFILDHVEGFVWPGADVALLREAAHAWRRASASVTLLVDHVDIATEMVGRQLSPEVPTALSCLADLRSLVVDAAEELAALGESCEDHADAIEEAHARTRALLAEIGRMVIEGAAISVIVGGLTGGLGASATGAAAAARIRAQAPRFHALLVGLRASIAASGTRLRRVEDSLRDLRAQLDRYAKAAVRDERGEMRLPGGWRTTVGAQDRLGGHVLVKHVGMTTDDLAARARTEKLPFASSFDDAASAEKHIAQALSRERVQLDTWLSEGGGRLRVDTVLSTVTGVSVNAAGTIQRVQGVRIILARSAESPSGYRILTAFPQP